MTTHLKPAYTIRYKETEDSVVVQSHSLDGRAHDGGPKHLRHADLPTFLFQLVDARYQIVPGNDNAREHYRECWPIARNLLSRSLCVECKRLPVRT